MSLSWALTILLVLLMRVFLGVAIDELHLPDTRERLKRPTSRPRQWPSPDRERRHPDDDVLYTAAWACAEVVLLP